MSEQVTALNDSEMLPTPDELETVYAVMAKLTDALFSELVDGDLWGDLVEAKRQIAVATSYLGQTRGEPYVRAWEEMISLGLKL